MNRKVLFPMANGTEEAEAIIVVDLLRRANVEVILAGFSDIITTSHNIKIIPDILLTNIHNSDIFDAIVLPGGLVGVNTFIESDYLLDLLKLNYRQDNLIAAICAAPLVLKAANILNGNQKYTCNPGVIDKMNIAGFTADTVVQDNNIITSRGVGTAIQFALAIIENLYDKEKSQKIAKDIVWL